MVERARLESVYTVLSRIEGSNPSLSANYTRVYYGYANGNSCEIPETIVAAIKALEE